MKKALFLLLSLTLLFSACGKQEATELYALIPMVNIDGELYLDTGFSADHPNTLEYDGHITTQVDGSCRPTQHEQSNFGTGYDYIFVDEGVIILHLEGGWYFFATEEERENLQFPLNSNENREG